MKNFDGGKLEKTLKDSSEIAAAYLFGSAIANEPVVNDLDLLLLLYPGVDKNVAYFELVHRIATALTLSEDQIDILFFDLREADPNVLYEAVNKGIILKNALPDLLGEKIEDLSLCLMNNEIFRKRAKQFHHERLEMYSAY